MSQKFGVGPGMIIIVYGSIHSDYRTVSHYWVLLVYVALHSGGNDRFCARLKTDISAFSSGLQGHLRSCLTILDSARRPLSKNVRHDLVRPRRPELEAEMSVFNLAQKWSFPPLWATTPFC
jgi:hypothetical protein